MVERRDRAPGDAVGTEDRLDRFVALPRQDELLEVGVVGEAAPGNAGMFQARRRGERRDGGVDVDRLREGAVVIAEPRPGQAVRIAGGECVGARVAEPALVRRVPEAFVEGHAAEAVGRGFLRADDLALVDPRQAIVLRGPYAGGVPLTVLAVVERVVLAVDETDQRAVGDTRRGEHPAAVAMPRAVLADTGTWNR